MEPIYTPSELAELRKATNARSVASLSRSASGTDKCLTPDEELQLVNHYIMTLPHLCTDIGNEVVYLTALFLREFYVHNSVMDYPPAVILFAALLVAAKSLEIEIDEYFLPTKMKMKGIEKKVPEVLAFEVDMMVAIDGMMHRETPFIILEHFNSYEKVIKKGLVAKVIVSDISLVHDAATIGLALHLAAGGAVTDERYIKVKDRVKRLATEMRSLKPIFDEKEMGRLNSKAKAARSLAPRKRKKMGQTPQGAMSS